MTEEQWIRERATTIDVTPAKNKRLKGEGEPVADGPAACHLSRSFPHAVARLRGTGVEIRAVLIGQGFQIGFSAAVPTLESNYFSRKSAHFCIWSFCPQGIIGTDEVEFFGEPSMRRSE